MSHCSSKEEKTQHPVCWRVWPGGTFGGAHPDCVLQLNYGSCNFPEQKVSKSKSGFYFWAIHFDAAHRCPLTVAVRNLDRGHVRRAHLFLGAGGLVARMSSWAVWWCWALWMGLRVNHHRDATPGLLVPSVSPAAQPSEPHMIEGYRFTSIRRFCVWAWERGSTKDGARQPLIYSPEPRNMLQYAPVRVRNLPLAVRHGKTVPK